MTSTATNVAAANLSSANTRASATTAIDINDNNSLTDRTINTAMYCLAPSAILTVLGLIVGYVVWLVYSIIALTETSLKA